MAAAQQVATNTAPLSIPASASIDGLTKIIYAIVKNVVKPAIISVLGVVPWIDNLNSLSNILYISHFNYLIEFNTTIAGNSKTQSIYA